MHILRVAGIDNGDDVALDGVSVVPLVGVCHVVSFPSADGGTTARQRSFYGVDGKESIAHVPFHVFVRIGVAILLGHVPIERPDFGSRTLRVEILILHLSRRR